MGEVVTLAKEQAVPVCADCKFYRPGRGGPRLVLGFIPIFEPPREPMCQYPGAIDHVTGETMTFRCRDMRSDFYKQSCGNRARYFQRKEPA